MEVSLFHGLVANAFDEDKDALLHLFSLPVSLRDLRLHLLQHISEHLVKLRFGVAELFGELGELGLHLLVFGDELGVDEFDAFLA